MSKPDFVWPALDHAASEAQDIEARRQQAFDEGYAAGHAKGLAAAEGEVADHYKQLADAASAIERLEHADAAALHKVVSAVLSSVLDVELSSNADVYRNFLQLAIQSLAVDTARLQLNTATLERMRALDVDSEYCQMAVDDTLPDGALRLVAKDSMVVFDPKDELDRLLSASDSNVEADVQATGVVHDDLDGTLDEASSIEVR